MLTKKIDKLFKFKLFKFKQALIVVLALTFNRFLYFESIFECTVLRSDCQTICGRFLNAANNAAFDAEF